MADLTLNLLLPSGKRCGSTSTFLQTFQVREQVADSVTLFRRAFAPFLHVKACLMSKGSPHAQKPGKSCKGRLYLIRNEALNPCLLRA